LASTEPQDRQKITRFAKNEGAVGDKIFEILPKTFYFLFLLKNIFWLIF